MITNPKIVEKWSVLIQAAKNYWIDSVPTGLTDTEFDTLEKKALKEDNFSARDYVFEKYLVGVRTQNKYIEKITKFKIPETSNMLKSMVLSANELGIDKDELYCDLKYDGSSIALYLEDGRVKRIVTVGNSNTTDFGVDQTWKLFKFVDAEFPKGIKAIQCEALIDLDRIGSLDPDRARQKANGLINSKYCEDEVDNLLTLRAYRYYLDDTYEGIKLRDNYTYDQVLKMFPTVTGGSDNHIWFSPADTWTLGDLLRMNNDITETYKTKTSTGTFLNDGWVLYNKHGICQRALKYPGAGSGTELIKTTVRGIQWNDVSSKGKDSWSANVLIDPITIHGVQVKKPSAGSVSKLIKNNISEGAVISIVLANSVIPTVGKVYKGGNGNYQWPVCSCGYQMGPKDIYGSILKCGNPMCTNRIQRMRKVIKPGEDLDLNALLVIDRYRWENSGISKQHLWDLVHENKETEFYEYLKGFLKSDLQKRTLDLVWKAAWIVMREIS